jgi:FAD/FMN-containing dehydrogenase
MDTPINRRELLGRATGVAVALAAGSQLGSLAGCGSPQTTNDAAELARSAGGVVVGPGDAGYEHAKRVFNPRFDGARPRAIVFCEDSEDVAEAIGFARRRDIRIVARNGAHSYAGYSTSDGIVADVSRMNEVEVDRSRATARIGSGALLIDVYSRLARNGVFVPVGTCPTVGISGLALGGGFGFSSRKFGLTSDNLVSLEIVTADGRVLTCDMDREADLFWACRGGGGGNFGVVTGLEFEVHPIRDVAIYQASWDMRHAGAVVDAWQRWAPATPDAMYSVCQMQKPGGRRPGTAGVTSQGQYFGAPETLRELLEPIIAAAPPSELEVRRMSFIDAARLWAGCTGGVAQCRDVRRYPRTYKSDFVNELLPGEAIDTIVRRIDGWPGGDAPDGAVLQMNSWGGAINRVGEAATAFVHRDARVLLQYIATWGDKDPRRVADANLEWIGEFYADMRPYVSGFAYQNMIDPELGDWQHAYYGSNLDRLVEVKRRYDPDEVFRFAQSIPASA